MIVTFKNFLGISIISRNYQTIILENVSLNFISRKMKTKKNLKFRKFNELQHFSWLTVEVVDPIPNSNMVNFLFIFTAQFPFINFLTAN